MDLFTHSEIDFQNSKNINLESEENEDYNELQKDIVSSGELLFVLDNSNNINENEKFPLDPEIKLQNIGKDINRDDIDINSKLLNLDKPLNRDVTNNLKEEFGDNKILDTTTFNVESTYLTNPPQNIKGLSKNRWIELFNNPQNNSIEPFDRIGNNTVLNELDTFESCY